MEEIVHSEVVQHSKYRLGYKFEPGCEHGQFFAEEETYIWLG